jgi:hypothetical protein
LTWLGTQKPRAALCTLRIAPQNHEFDRSFISPCTLAGLQLDFSVYAGKVGGGFGLAFVVAIDKKHIKEYVGKKEGGCDEMTLSTTFKCVVCCSIMTI